MLADGGKPPGLVFPGTPTDIFKGPKAKAKKRTSVVLWRCATWQMNMGILHITPINLIILLYIYVFIYYNKIQKASLKGHSCSLDYFIFTCEFREKLKGLASNFILFEGGGNKVKRIILHLHPCKTSKSDICVYFSIFPLSKVILHVPLHQSKHR